MNVLVAFDKFKDSMSAPIACSSAAAGVFEALGQDVAISEEPLTDGGEGFCPILARAAGGWIESHQVCGPLGDLIEAPLGWVETSNLSKAARDFFPQIEGRIAIIEMAAVAGLEQVPTAQRHPKHCTTRGVGELIRIATAEEADAILLGIGGSATSDLGIGALEALCIEFPENSRTTPEKWARLESVKTKDFQVPPIFVACDVDNPLTGPRGAAVVYGPQKGLKPEEISDFDNEAGRMATLLCQSFGQPTSLQDTPGSGAAGGIGFGLKVAFDADFIAGFDLVTAWLDLSTKIEAADLVISGEGKIDMSSLAGKGPVALAQAAEKAGVPCRLFAGLTEADARDALEQTYSRTKAFSISPEELSLELALKQGPVNLQRRVAEVLKRDEFRT